MGSQEKNRDTDNTVEKIYNSVLLTSGSDCKKTTDNIFKYYMPPYKQCFEWLQYKVGKSM